MFFCWWWRALGDVFCISRSSIGSDEWFVVDSWTQKTSDLTYCLNMSQNCLQSYLWRNSPLIRTNIVVLTNLTRSSNFWCVCHKFLNFIPSTKHYLFLENKTWNALQLCCIFNSIVGYFDDTWKYGFIVTENTITFHQKSWWFWGFVNGKNLKLRFSKTHKQINLSAGGCSKGKIMAVSFVYDATKGNWVQLKIPINI